LTSWTLGISLPSLNILHNLTDWVAHCNFHVVLFGRSARLVSLVFLTCLYISLASCNVSLPSVETATYELLLLCVNILYCLFSSCVVISSYFVCFLKLQSQAGGLLGWSWLQPGSRDWAMVPGPEVAATGRRLIGAFVALRGEAFRPWSGGVGHTATSRGQLLRRGKRTNVVENVEISSLLIVYSCLSMFTQVQQIPKFPQRLLNRYKEWK